MRSAAMILALTTGLLAPSTSMAVAPERPALDAPPPVPARQSNKDGPCVAYWPEARYVIGYDHIVHLLNQCDATATCTVASNVNPEPTVVVVPIGERADVVTWRGSPTGRFIPIVSCSLGEPT